MLIKKEIYMCLTTARNPKIMIAIKDIPVLKRMKVIVIKSELCVVSDMMHSNQFYYKLGKKYAAKGRYNRAIKTITVSKPKTHGTFYRINAGWHSWDAAMDTYGKRIQEPNVKCFIPKGAKYVKDGDRYVSTQIVFESIMKTRNVRIDSQSKLVTIYKRKEGR